MLIKLQDIIDELDKSYRLDVSGHVAGAVTAIERLPADENIKLNPGTLYICSPADLGQNATNDDMPCFLCVANPSAILDIPTFPSRRVIIVRCESASDVLVKLSEIMFDLGRRGSIAPELLSAMVECVSLKALVDIGYRFLGNPIVITDAGRNPLEYTRRVDIDDSAWEEFVTTGQLFIDTRIISEMLQSPAGVMSQSIGIVSHERTSQAPQVVQKAIVSQGVFLGYLFLAGFLRDITDKDIETVSLLGNFAAGILLGRNTASKETGSLESYLETLLDLGYNNPEEVMEQAAIHGWRPKKYLYVMVCGSHGQVAGKTRRDLAREILSAVPDLMHLNYKNGSAFVWETNRLLTENDERLKGLLTLAQKYKTRVGISRNFSSPADIKKFYFQARKAMELGEMFERDFYICPYERYSIFHVMELCESYEDLDNFCYPGFNELIEQDRKNDSQLLDTLAAFLNNRGSMVKTAAQMTVHENTVKYRMKVITKILGCDLSEGETFFKLYFTIKAHEFLEKRLTMPAPISSRVSR